MPLNQEFLDAELSDDSDTEVEAGQSVKQRLRKKYFKSRKQLPATGRRYIPVFRGVKFLPVFFPKNSWRRKIALEEGEEQDIFSNMSFRNAGLLRSDIGKYMAGELSAKNLARLRQTSDSINAFLEILYRRQDLKVKINSGYFYESLYYFLLQVNTDLYSKFNETQEKLIQFLTNVSLMTKLGINLKPQEIEIIKVTFADLFAGGVRPAGEDGIDHRPDRKPFISTGLDTNNCVRYALPIEDLQKIDGVTDGVGGRVVLQAFNPGYDQSGRPKHRFAGIVHIILIPEEAYFRDVPEVACRRQTDNGPHLPIVSDIQVLNERYWLNIETRIINSSQAEVAVSTKLPSDWLVAKVPLYFPNFAQDKQFQTRYHNTIFGLDKANFDYIKSLLQQNKIKDAEERILTCLENQVSDVCYATAFKIAAENQSTLVLPKIHPDKTVTLGCYPRRVTLHARKEKEAGKKTEKPVTKEVADEHIKIAFNSATMGFNLRKVKASGKMRIGASR